MNGKRPLSGQIWSSEKRWMQKSGKQNRLDSALYWRYMSRKASLSTLRSAPWINNRLEVWNDPVEWMNPRLMHMVLITNVVLKDSGPAPPPRVEVFCLLENTAAWGGGAHFIVMLTSGFWSAVNFRPSNFCMELSHTHIRPFHRMLLTFSHPV